MRLIDAIERIHGRLGKILISQYLSGSQNAKIQKLRLHRLSGFGMLEGSKQADVMELLDLLLANGLLKQQEVKPQSTNCRSSSRVGGFEAAAGFGVGCADPSEAVGKVRFSHLAASIAFTVGR